MLGSTAEGAVSGRNCPTLAQAGGRDPKRIGEALAVAQKWLERELQS